MLTTILFFVGLALLVKGADFLVDGAAAIARGFHLSNISIGLTIVAFGTSMPELVVNLFATSSNQSDIAIGNVLGSNIFNILLILGLSAAITPLKTLRNTVNKEIPLSLLAAVLVGIMANDVWIDGSTSNALSRIDGMVFIAFFIIFMYYTFGIAGKVDTDDKATDGEKYAIMPLGKSILYCFLGLVGLVLGGKWIVDGAVEFATILGISEAVIGLTIVAAGTSLPELATSAAAAYKKQMDIAIGNAVGSNIFNIFFVLGISAFIKPLPFAQAANLDIAMTVFASALLFILLYVGKKHIVQRWQGILMMLSYIAYVVYLINR